MTTDLLEKLQLQNQLPEGYYARPVEMRDLEPMVALFADFTRAQSGRVENSVESLRTEWETPQRNLVDNTLGIFTAAGEPVGYTEFWDMIDPHVRFSAWSAVHPALMQTRISEVLFDWLIQRAHQSLLSAPEGARVTLQHYINSSHLSWQQKLAERGFKNIRTSNFMRIDFTEPPQPPEIPAGIVIRSIASEAEDRAASHAAWESFKDHWGFVDEPFEAFYKRHHYFVTSDPNYDPTLLFIALDGDEVAGVSLCRDHIEEDPDQGWVGTLGVRRPWRKRGVGLALLQYSFCEFYRRGKPRAGLGVDASSLTGALRLYERAGMHVLRSLYCYELELRPGKDLTTQSIQ